MTTRFYVGPVDAVTANVEGRDVYLSRGESVEVSDETAELMDRTPEVWSPDAPAEPVLDDDAPEQAPNGKDA